MENWELSCILFWRIKLVQINKLILFKQPSMIKIYFFPVVDQVCQADPDLKLGYSFLNY